MKEIMATIMGGPHDGKRMRVPDLGVIELVDETPTIEVTPQESPPSEAQTLKRSLYFKYVLTNGWLDEFVIYRHSSIDAEYVLSRLIHGYKQK